MVMYKIIRYKFRSGSKRGKNNKRKNGCLISAPEVGVGEEGDPQDWPSQTEVFSAQHVAKT
jgi:hypothetical protein